MLIRVIYRASIAFKRSAFVLVLASLSGPAAAQSGPAQWQLGARPSVAIGAEGNQKTEFLRIGKVLRLPGGEIVVANAGSNEIRVFDGTGRYLHSLGRAGAGPGEFKNLSLLGHAGDTLFLGDGINQRITLFRADGTLLKTIPITVRAAGRLSVLGRLRNGRWLLSAIGGPTLNGPERTFRDTSRIGTMGPDASGDVVWLTLVPSLTYFVHNPTNGPHGDVVGLVPLAPTAVSVVSGDEVIVGDTGDNVIGAYADTGALLHLIPVPLVAPHLTDAKIAQLRKQAMDQNPSERSRPWLTALYSRAVMGQRLPVFGYVVPAPDGSLWVQAGPADPTVPATWLVLDTEGKPKARISTPQGFRITEVGASYVLGVYTDANGVETVRLYTLDRK